MRIYSYTILDEELAARLHEVAEPEDEVILRRESDSDEKTKNTFRQADVVLGNVPTEWLADAPEQLAYLQLDSAGFDKYQGIPLKARVANMGDWFARPCAETIVGGLAALYRGLDALTLLKQNKQWVGHAMRTHLGVMDRQRVVVLGGGTIGTAVRDILGGYRCRVKTLARTNPDAELHSKNELMVALPEVDILINTLPGTAENYVDRDLIAAMRPGSVYANVGRGNTTDETALIEALQSGHLSGAVLDVTEQEPLPADHVLWTLPNVILTQHTGGGQAEEHAGKVEIFIRNIQNLRNGDPIESEVDLARGY